MHTPERNKRWETTSKYEPLESIENTCSDHGRRRWPTKRETTHKPEQQDIHTKATQLNTTRRAPKCTPNRQPQSQHMQITNPTIEKRMRPKMIGRLRHRTTRALKHTCKSTPKTFVYPTGGGTTRGHTEFSFPCVVRRVYGHTELLSSQKLLGESVDTRTSSLSRDWWQNLRNAPIPNVATGCAAVGGACGRT